MNDRLKTMFELDKLIHEPARLMILMLLYQISEVDFVYLLNETGLTRGNLSSHLTKLEEGGLIALEKGLWAASRRPYVGSQKTENES